MSVIDDVQEGSANVEFKVVYGDNEVKEGVILTPTQVKDQPIVSWKHEDGALYTLVKTDPDAPSRENPEFGEWRHWVVMNIKGNDINNGFKLDDYVGCGAPKDTGLHRYIFLLFKQKEEIKTEGLNPRTSFLKNGREKNSTRKLIEQFDLGNPIAATWYRGEWDDYVPTLYAQFTD